MRHTCPALLYTTINPESLCSRGINGGLRGQSTSLSILHVITFVASPNKVQLKVNVMCTYRLNWARGTSWGWLDDTVLQTQDSKFESWRSEAEFATSRSRRLPIILSLYEWAGKKHSVSLKLECQSGVRTRDFRDSFNHCTTMQTLALGVKVDRGFQFSLICRFNSTGSIQPYSHFGVHITISVLPGTHLHLSEMNCLT